MADNTNKVGNISNACLKSNKDLKQDKQSSRCPRNKESGADSSQWQTSG